MRKTIQAAGATKRGAVAVAGLQVRQRTRTSKRAPWWQAAETFVAIDFETADYERDSACAVGLVRVEGDRIVRREARLIRPPRPHVLFTAIHGITWADVAAKPSFGEVWPALSDVLEGADVLAAHSAAFDRAVLRACCARYRLNEPETPFECTMVLARRVFDIRPTRLPDVCRRLGIKLRHHDALSDAEAAARIVLAAKQEAPEAARSGTGTKRRMSADLRGT